MDEQRKKLYLDIARNWNKEDKKVIAERNGVSIFSVSVIARTIGIKTGMEMRIQRATPKGMYTEEFVKELKKAYRK